MYQTIRYLVRKRVAHIVLARPELRNAFDDTMISELSDALARIGQDPSVRAVLLTAEGRSFCAGADVGWMRRMAEYDPAANLADAMGLATMLSALAGLPKPTVARVQGHVFGGGLGLVACCDIAVASEEAEFCASEVKLGLTPATISPYVVAAMGERAARRYFLTAERFRAAEALRLNLVHAVVPAAALDAAIEEILGHLLQGGPSAQAAAKELVRDVARRPLDRELIHDTASRIASIRSSTEGREGIASFLEKRRPVWATELDND